MLGPYEHTTRPIEALIPWARNARTHSPAQIAQVAGAIREFGFTNPVLIDEHDSILAGHCRVLAARKLNVKHIPCIVVTGLTETQKRALVVSDNKLSLNSGWDDDMLVMELGELADSGVSLDVVGFSKAEMDSLLDGWKPDELVKDEGMAADPKCCPHCGQPLTD